MPDYSVTQLWFNLAAAQYLTAIHSIHPTRVGWGTGNKTELVGWDETLFANTEEEKASKNAMVTINMSK